MHKHIVAIAVMEKEKYLKPNAMFAKEIKLLKEWTRRLYLWRKAFPMDMKL